MVDYLNLDHNNMVNYSILSNPLSRYLRPIYSFQDEIYIIGLPPGLQFELILIEKSFDVVDIVDPL